MKARDDVDVTYDEAVRRGALRFLATGRYLDPGFMRMMHAASPATVIMTPLRNLLGASMLTLMATDSKTAKLSSSPKTPTPPPYDPLYDPDATMLEVWALSDALKAKRAAEVTKKA